MHLSEKGHTYALFAIVVITCALGSLTQTVMNSMLTEVCDDFAIDAAQGQWVTTIYMLTMGVTVPVVTYLARRFSLKRLVYLALGFYLAGSVAGLFAPVFAVLIAARVLQAIATGITLPLVQSVAMTRFPRERTGTAMGIGGIAMGFAPNIGPLIGGALAGSWGWRSFYIILAGLLAVLWVANAVLVKSHGDHDTRPVFDYPSFVQSTLGFGGLLLGASNAATMPLSAPFGVVAGASGCGVYRGVRAAPARDRPSAHLLGYFRVASLPARVRGAELPVRVVHGHHARSAAVHPRALPYDGTGCWHRVHPRHGGGAVREPVGRRAGGQGGRPGRVHHFLGLPHGGSRLVHVRGPRHAAVGPHAAAGCARRGCERAGGAAELLWVVGLERRPRHGRQRVLRHGPSGVRLAGHGTYDADRHRGGCGRSRRGSGRCGAAAVDGGASLSALPYQLAFALSTLFAAAVLVTALWKIR